MNNRELKRELNKIEDNLQRMRAELELWKAVTRERKKDGSDFQNLQKNFTGARIVQEYTWSSKTVRVSGRYNARDRDGDGYHNGWLEDTIYLNENETTPDAIEKKITERIARDEEYCKRYAEGLAKFEECAREIDGYIEKINAVIKSGVYGFISANLHEYARENIKYYY